jgi:hypothetical protein
MQSFSPKSAVDKLAIPDKLSSSKNNPAPHYLFLNAEQESKLVTLFCNYLSLGEFELARAILLQLEKIDPQKASSLIGSLLKDGIPKEWYASFLNF